jgi:hypothetical protein
VVVRIESKASCTRCKLSVEGRKQCSPCNLDLSHRVALDVIRFLTVFDTRIEHRVASVVDRQCQVSQVVQVPGEGIIKRIVGTIVVVFHDFLDPLSRYWRYCHCTHLYVFADVVGCVLYSTVR